MRIFKTAIVMAACVAAIAGCQFTQERTESVVMTSPSSGAIKTPAQLGTFPPPQWKVGDNWEYSDGYGVNVVQVRDDGVTKFQRTDDLDQWFIRRALFKEESQSSKVHRLVVYRTGDPMSLFTTGQNQPVSYVREYTRNGELVRHRTSWVIEGKETITVPAGTFDCWIVVMRTQSLDSNWRGFERWYYSPEVRNFVRMEFKYGESPSGSRVLMKYGLAK